jgi:hypothetical protein
MRFMEAPCIIAHRTCPADEAENSLAGIHKAADLGADGVEIDLRMSLDQRPFLMHDDTMRRTTGWRLPLELTPSFLVRRQRLPNGERVPSLGEAFEALPAGLVLAVDVKTPWAIVPLVGEIRRRGMQSRTLVWCQTSAPAPTPRNDYLTPGGVSEAALAPAPRGHFWTQRRAVGAGRCRPTGAP